MRARPTNRELVRESVDALRALVDWLGAESSEPSWNATTQSERAQRAVEALEDRFVFGERTVDHI